jgi:hypothetical protein
MTAAEALSLALVDLVDRGKRTPCQSSSRGRWTSDSADDRAWEASVCVTLRCVWGGRDRTVTAKTRKAS